jgi:hypothetical protein
VLRERSVCVCAHAVGEHERDEGGFHAEAAVGLREVKEGFQGDVYGEVVPAGEV